MDDFFYWVGLLVCVAGGIIAVAVMFEWASERLFHMFTNSQAIYRIAAHARKNGIDLRTGKEYREGSGHE